MSSLQSSVLDAVEAGGQPWPGPLSPADRAELERLLGSIGEEERTVLVGAMLDPERNAWGRAAVQALHHVLARGARFTGYVGDDVLGFEDQRRERFGVVPLPFSWPSHPGGAEGDVTRMLSTLDSVFGQRRYALWVRRSLPADVDVEPVRRAVHLWLSALDRGDRTESHAVYEDDDIALDLTLLATRPPAGTRSGRVVTVMPLPSLERLAAVDGRVIEASSMVEESSGDLPLVCFAAADRPWRVSRGYLQQLLYGTADRVEILPDGAGVVYEAEFTATGRSMFSDPACRLVAEVVLASDGPTPFGYSAVALQNPWAAQGPDLQRARRMFAVHQANGRKAVLRWERKS